MPRDLKDFRTALSIAEVAELNAASTPEDRERLLSEIQNARQDAEDNHAAHELAERFRKEAGIDPSEFAKEPRQPTRRYLRGETENGSAG
jgi:hypothetical protein